MYTRILIALLAATAVVARPQDDIDVSADENFLEELPIADGLGPDVSLTGCTPGPAPAGCGTGNWCKPNPGQGGTCQNACTGNNMQNPTTPEANECPAVSGQTALCYKHACTSTCTTTCPSGSTCTTVGSVKICVPNPPASCMNGQTDTCPAKQYCQGGTTCTAGCKNGATFATAADATAGCPNAAGTGKAAPAYCENHQCTYSECTVTGMTDSCAPAGTCTAGAHGIKKCVPKIVVPPPSTSCNSYKKCADGFFCHNRKCKEGCEGKYSACKTKAPNSKKGTCDGKACVPYTDKETGAPCKRKSDCKGKTQTSLGFKCVADSHGHHSHCRKVVAETKACNQKNTLFPDVCDKNLVCKNHVCKKVEHKEEHENYHH